MIGKDQLVSFMCLIIQSFCCMGCWLKENIYLEAWLSFGMELNKDYLEQTTSCMHNTVISKLRVKSLPREDVKHSRSSNNASHYQLPYVSTLLDISNTLNPPLRQYICYPLKHKNYLKKYTRATCDDVAMLHMCMWNMSVAIRDLN